MQVLQYLLHLRKIFPTIGIKLDTAAFVVFTVKASTPFVILPSNELTPTKTVKTIPKIQITALFINLDNLSICIFSDKFETIVNVIPTSNNGIKNEFIKKVKDKIEFEQADICDFEKMKEILSLQWIPLNIKVNP